MVTEERVKDYWIKVQYQPLEEEEKKARREASAQVILQSIGCGTGEKVCLS